MLRPARVWILEECGIDILEEVNDLPMVVSCTCCNSTLALPNAFIDGDGEIYCPSCAGE